MIRSGVNLVEVASDDTHKIFDSTEIAFLQLKLSQIPSGNT